MWSVGRSHESLSSVLFSARSAAISSRSIPLSSLVLTYLSRATLSSIRSMILSVVSTPTSLVISTSSRSSNTSSSTFDFPATARASLSNTLVFVFCRPLSSVSFLSLLKNPNIPMIFNFSFCKGSANRAKYKEKYIFSFISEVQPT